MREWKIQKSHLSCQTCNKEIESGQHFWSRLVENQIPDEPNLLRQDYCQDHWPTEGESFCFWRTLHKDDPKPYMLDFDTLLGIFRDCDPQSQDPRKLNFRYLLALILMRKKLLREIEGSTSQCLRLTDSVTNWEVPVPQMSEEDEKLAEEDIGQLIVNPLAESSQEN